MKKKESKKEELLRRLEENREFFHKTGKMSYASLMEELIEYIKHQAFLQDWQESIDTQAKNLADTIDADILKTKII